ncbi:PilN domain-containing protein [Alkalibacter mobilis]|uniref:PilN domain-containing protein n=1 Tax=Alkalibacter mobilis TaxID=2787712 RepID=UPI00189E788D|nr:PilN domain-containing protein [Alkalibacter mobilis]MBF7095752.1 PilN domain-containing protein [Alkalibacter mobilis]
MRDINLLPDELYQQKDNKQKRAMFILKVLGFLAVLLVIYGGMYYLNMQVTNDIKQVESEITALADVQARKTLLDKKKAELSHREGVVSTMDEGKTNFFDLLGSVEATLPDTIKFTRQEAEGGQMHLNGTAGSRDEVAQLAAKLAQIQGVENVWINSVNVDETLAFDIAFTYNGGDQQ